MSKAEGRYTFILLPRHTGEGREGESRRDDLTEKGDHDLKSANIGTEARPLLYPPPQAGEDMNKARQ